MQSPFTDVHILWITAGLGCDGDSVAITAATQPSLEDLVHGIIPGIPKVHFHNPLLATENGEAFMRYFHDAAEAAPRIRSFCGAWRDRSPTKPTSRRGYWAAFGADPVTRQPITTCTWLESA